MNNPFSHYLPPQRPPAELGLDVRLSHLKRWSGALDSRQLGETTRALLERLRLTNRTQMGAAERFAWLESLVIPLNGVLDGLRRHYLHKPFPLPTKSQSVAQLANTLNSEMVVGYRLVLAAKPVTSWFGRRADRQRRLLACFRLFTLAGELLNNYRLLYLPPPPGLWRHLHSYYRQLLALGWEREVLLHVKGGADITIEARYKRELLLSLLPTQMFAETQWRALQQRLDEWVAQAPLYRAAQRPTGKRLFCIRFDLDTPLAAATEVCCGACDRTTSGLLLDTEPLLEMVEWALAGSAPEQSPLHEQSPACRLPQELLQQLLRAWRIPHEPREERKRIDLPLQLVCGLHEIHKLLASGKGAAAPQQGHEEHAGEGVTIGYRGREVAEAPPLWHGGAEEGLKAHASDASGHGFRVELELPPSHTFQLGELVALRSLGHEGWSLCLLRWARRIDERHAALGLERIAEHPHPVEVRVATADATATQAQPGLTCYDQEMNATLLMPLLLSRTASELHLAHQGGGVAILLEENLALSPRFDAYRFSSADKEVAIDPLMPQLIAANGEAFGELWGSL